MTSAIMPAMNRHRDRVRSSFTAQAKGFSSAALTLSNERYIQWIVDALPLRPDMRVIDMACGTGIMARTLAPFTQYVTGVDITPAMLNEARELAEIQGLTNIEFLECPAEATGLASEAFNLAITRFTLHHFENPVVQLFEMARVTKRRGCIAVVDLVSPEDPTLADRYNYYERLRDPSHTAALSAQRLQDVIQGAGITIIHTDKVRVEVNVDRWLALTKPSETVAQHIIDDLNQEIVHGTPATGLSPSKDPAGRLVFRQDWMLLIGTRT